MQNYLNFIDGEWVPAHSGKTYQTFNPADTRQCLGSFPDSDAADVEAAVEAAARAYERWRLVPAPKRAEILFRAAELLVQRKEPFARQMTEEMGKVLKETRGDVQEAIDMSYFMAGEGRRLYGQTTPAELPSKFAMSIRQSVGVCGLITPWNFPMAIPSWKLMPALVCGNTCVIKPAESTPISAINLVKTLQEAGLPKGVVNLVCGHGPQVGAPIVTHPKVRVVSFTGSTEVGRLVAQAAAPTFKHCHMEMGGKNVIMVLDDADIDLAVEGAVWGGFGTTGQRCTAASRVVVHRKVYQEFAEKFVSRARKIKVGNGLDETVEMGPSHSESQMQTVLNYIEIGKGEAELLTGGSRLTEGDLRYGYFIEPTIFGNVPPTARIAQEEIFGPVVALIPCDSLEEAIAIGNGVEYGLSAAIYTRDVNRAFIAMRDMYTGIFYVNSSTIGAEVHLPFGGTKNTGNGHREAGIAALDIFSEWKSIYIDYSGRLQKAQIDEYKGE
ncbi:MAG: aldehyde dehydrogenase family protein [Acidobacteriota bacterium]|nr:aldehyde dehydrogenase family protein [Blastocatellia bacterium]MDW8413620.1 aldehyde dehydrogenase family protein [Acidobacteriota bacterium]